MTGVFVLITILIGTVTVFVVIQVYNLISFFRFRPLHHPKQVMRSPQLISLLVIFGCNHIQLKIVQQVNKIKETMSLMPVMPEFENNITAYWEKNVCFGQTLNKSICSKSINSYYTVYFTNIELKLSFVIDKTSHCIVLTKHTLCFKQWYTMQQEIQIDLMNASSILIILRIIKQILFSNHDKEKHNVTNIKAKTNTTTAALQSKKAASCTCIDKLQFKK